MPGLIGALIQRGWQANQDRALLESLVGYDQANAPDANAGAPSGGAPGAGQGAPPAPATPRTGGGGFDPSQAGNNTGDPDQPSQAAQRGTQAEAIRKVIQAYAPDAKDLHTALKGMSADQLEGMLKAYTVQSTLAEHRARMSDWQAQANLRNQQAQDDQSVGAAVNRYGSMPQVPIDPSGEADGLREPTPRERMNYALSTPGLAGRAVPKLIQALSQYNSTLDTSGKRFFDPSQKEAPLPSDLQQDWARIPTGPNTSQMVPRHGSSVSALPITGPGGESLGFAVPTGRGAMNIVKNPAELTTAERTSLLNTKKAYLAERSKAFLPEDKAHWDSAISEIDAQLGTAPSGGGGAAPANVVTTKAQRDALKSGTVYTYQGKQYTKQ